METKNKFKPGDKVRCVTPGEYAVTGTDAIHPFVVEGYILGNHLLISVHPEDDGPNPPYEVDEKHFELDIKYLNESKLKKALGVE